ncbi:hypothetical protein [Sphingomonas prati]|uniref:MarR family transcriptional regulator n=1 Tax=Sphingomonas prati TaxID=1843237 RepID=A0A7W9BTY4_9SPHN|nr:hypothetical protein [Sphingomonas prati]MBB5729578.1 hypothetical protein [Sphingomonas prati]GGE76375.1 hypothetical protein GCM10011404_06270 [Sphingomonas prati]
MTDGHDMPDDDTDYEAMEIAAEIGVAQRRVVMALSDDWQEADDHRTAKRMTAIRDAKGLIQRRGKSENAWRLTVIGVRVKRVLLADLD